MVSYNKLSKTLLWTTAPNLTSSVSYQLVKERNRWVTNPWHFTAFFSPSPSLRRRCTSSPPNCGRLRMLFHACIGVISPSLDKSGARLNRRSNMAEGAFWYSGAEVGGQGRDSDVVVAWQRDTQSSWDVTVSACPLGSSGLLGSPWMWPRQGSSILL